MLAEIYQDIFIDFCKLNLTQIIENEETSVLMDLLRLMGAGMKKQEQLLEDRYDERIRARYQTPFWREFLIQLQNLGSEGYKL